MLFRSQVPEVPGLTKEEFLLPRDATFEEQNCSERCVCGLGVEGHSSPRYTWAGGLLPVYFKWYGSNFCPGFWRLA